jgi:hypothetical protein
MVTDYPKEFLVWYEREGFAIFPAKDQAFRLWIAAMEEFKCNPPEGLYRIGEEVEVRPYSTWDETQKGKVVVLYGSLWTDSHECIRRKPAWMPKENEPVFVEVNGKATIGVWGTGYVHVGSEPGLRFSEVKPYDPTKVGKPWNEV